MPPILPLRPAGREQAVRVAPSRPIMMLARASAGTASATRCTPVARDGHLASSGFGRHGHVGVAHDSGPASRPSSRPVSLRVLHVFTKKVVSHLASDGSAIQNAHCGGPGAEPCSWRPAFASLVCALLRISPRGTRSEAPPFHHISDQTPPVRTQGSRQAITCDLAWTCSDETPRKIV
jgi:hypothetical protein